MSTRKTFNYGVDFLSARDAMAICRGEIQGLFGTIARGRVRVSSAIVAKIARANEPVYGINTGFGPLCTTMISPADTTTLQHNILKSHAVGVGEAIDVEISRLMLILKIHALAKGYSGICEATLDRMLWLLEVSAIPVVPKQGSVGASGDLAPLSHLFLPLIGLGKVHYRNEVVETAVVLKEYGLEPITLSAKEGLALINGTQFMGAHGVIAVERMGNLLNHADIISAMMLEGLKGSEKPFDERLHQLRPYVGTLQVAANMRALLKDSEIMKSHSDCAKVQDPYSLRCIPQVHGASRNAFIHLQEAIEIEINAVTDNPIIFDDESAISGGNFHGQPIALPFDYACLAASEIGNISDRRIYLSLEGNTDGVPKLLMRETGINSGFMIVQYTSAALASENKGLCFPSSADSIPTSLGQEDHVSMGSIGVRKLHQVLDNVEQILAIELFCAAQALDYHAPLKPGTILASVHQFVRSKVDHLEQDQLMYEMIETVTAILRKGALLQVAKDAAAKANISFMEIISN